MLSFQEFKRRGLIPLVLMVLATYYSLAYLTLTRRAEALDLPLDKAWRKLASSMNRSNAVALDFALITNRLAATRQALTALEGARSAALQRLEMPPRIRERLNAPFELFEYQNELSHQLDSLDTRAKKQSIGVEPPVFSGFPEHSFAVRDATMLWPALAFTESLLDSALRSRISVIHSLRASTDFPPAAGPTDRRWVEIPIEIEFSGPAPRALQFLQSLPLTEAELKEAGLPAPAGMKLPLLIDSFVIRKQAPDKPDEVRLWARVVGFVNRF